MHERMTERHAESHGDNMSKKQQGACTPIRSINLSTLMKNYAGQSRNRCSISLEGTAIPETSGEEPRKPLPP